ncbi:hypothetical protein BDQ17DRAFT_1428841 [Cyathus striatus]|nr:hypothetical protein BDQ17DRAFT_1428841 [Cyathus striatus]
MSPNHYILGFIFRRDNIAAIIQKRQSLNVPIRENDGRVLNFEIRAVSEMLNRSGYLYMGLGEHEDGELQNMIVVDEGRQKKMRAALNIWRERVEQTKRDIVNEEKAREAQKDGTSETGTQPSADTQRSSDKSPEQTSKNEDSDSEDDDITYVDKSIVHFMNLGIIDGPIVLKTSTL